MKKKVIEHNGYMIYADYIPEEGVVFGFFKDEQEQDGVWYGSFDSAIQGIKEYIMRGGKNLTTKKECEDILRKAGMVQGKGGVWYTPGDYCLNYGEFARPDYFVRYRKGKGFGIKVEYYYYSNVFNRPVNHFLDDEEIYSMILYNNLGVK